MSDDRMFEVEPVPRAEAPKRERYDVTVKQRTDLKIDLIEFFTLRLDEYLDFDQNDEDNVQYQWQEKPSNFIHHYIEDVAADSMWWTVEGDVQQGWDDLDTDMKPWTEDFTAGLHAELGLNREGTARIS